jgi:hypothetical protein
MRLPRVEDISKRRSIHWVDSKRDHRSRIAATYDSKLHRMGWQGSTDRPVVWSGLVLHQANQDWRMESGERALGV